MTLTATLKTEESSLVLASIAETLEFFPPYSDLAKKWGFLVMQKEPKQCKYIEELKVPLKRFYMYIFLASP